MSDHDSQPSDETAKRLEEVRAELSELEDQARQMAEGVGTGSDLVPARSDDPVVARKQMAAIRAEARKTALRIQANRKEMERLLSAEMQRAEEALAPMQKLMKHLEDGILTVNLYLGRDEEIVLLRDGESAPASQPITLRQMLLFMDEECAAAAEEGGIAPTDIETFDEWLLEDPAHLDQVLPEHKGIVALRPRRHPRPGQARDVAANRQTYWLVRNGERVYRTTTMLKIPGDRVLPYADEFERIFTKKQGRKRVPLRPGSFDWESAQRAAEQTEQTYMRIGLLLEGLLHRTPIFHPLPPQGISFLDPSCVRDGRVRYITDAEALLGTGQESFEQWRDRLAGELRAGMRVVLGPGLHNHNYEGARGNDRIHPSGATLPQTGQIYTIEEKKGSWLIIRYRREGETVYSSWYDRGHEPKLRASCKLRASDPFVLPYDLADEADLHRFLQSRSDRHRYAEMWPILHAAIAAKHAEAEAEEPFRTMLAGVLARENSVSVEQAQQAIPDLVDWFKLRNRYHRPLIFDDLGDEVDDLTESGQRRRSDAVDPGIRRRQRQRKESHEAKAVRMIVAEHARRMSDQRRGWDPEIVDRLRSEHPQALLIARPRRGGYLVLLAADPTVNVYVHELHYRANGQLRERREWVQPGATRPKQWTVIHASERWREWDLTASEREYLRGPEESALIEQMLSEVKGDKRALALAWADGVFTVWYMGENAGIDEQHPLTADQSAPTVHNRTRTWKRERAGLQLSGRESLRRDSTGDSLRGDRSEAKLPWDQLKWRSGLDEDDDEPRQQKYNVIWRNDPAILALRAEIRRYRNARQREEQLERTVEALIDSVERQWLDQAWAAERKRFDEDFGDPELWAAHRKSKERDVHFPYDLRRYVGSHDKPTTLWDALSLLVEAGEDPEGMTVEQVLAAATERFGAEHARRSRDSFGRKRDQPFVYEAPEEIYAYALAVSEDEDSFDDTQDEVDEEPEQATGDEEPEINGGSPDVFEGEVVFGDET
jgi:hypothetical protein